MLGTVKDASRRSAVASPKTRPSLTAPPRDARSRGRSAPGDDLYSLTRKSPPETPLLRRTKQNERPYDVLPKSDKLINYSDRGGGLPISRGGAWLECRAKAGQTARRRHRSDAPACPPAPPFRVPLCAGFTAGGKAKINGERDAGDARAEAKANQPWHGRRGVAVDALWAVPRLVRGRLTGKC